MINGVCHSVSLIVDNTFCSRRTTNPHLEDLTIPNSKSTSIQHRTWRGSSSLADTP